MPRFLGAKAVLATGAVLLSIGASAAGGQEINSVVSFRNDLLGTEEVPVADVDGSGTAVVKLNLDTGQVCFTVGARKTGTPNRAHIHVGAPGTNGAIVATFYELRIPPADPGAPATDPRNDLVEQGKFSDCVDADPALVNAMAANPTGYYVNLHNARFPGGAIRCQLQDA